MKIPSLIAIAILFSAMYVNAAEPEAAPESVKDLKEISFYVPAPERENSILKHRNALKYANEKLAASVKNMPEKQWYPEYHLAPAANWMNDPNGFCYFKDEYHIFYQHNPFAPIWDKIHWGHAVSKDMIHWSHKPVVLAPTDIYDKDGVFSGSAIEKDGLLYLIYTGQHEKDSAVTETINLAMSKDGINFVKSANNPIILQPPSLKGVTLSKEDFRNPYVWKHNDLYYMIVGTQNIPTKDGMVVIFQSKNLVNWNFYGISAIGHKGEMGYMWENPNLIQIGGIDVLVISPQGIKPSGKNFLNKFQSGWFLGKLDYETGKFKQTGAFGLFDKGFDFYAPQITQTPDGRTVMVGWLDMWGSSNPEKEEGWAGMMTIPRELKIVDKRLRSFPIEELKALRGNSVELKDKVIEGEKSFLQINGEAYEIETTVDLTDSNLFTIKLRTSATQETILSFNKKDSILKLNRDKSGKDLKGEREAKLDLQNNILKLHIFVDKSSVEIFANDEVVMSSRIYPDKKSTGIKLCSDGKSIIKNLNFYKLKSIQSVSLKDKEKPKEKTSTPSQEK